MPGRPCSGWKANSVNTGIPECSDNSTRREVGNGVTGLWGRLEFLFCSSLASLLRCHPGFYGPEFTAGSIRGTVLVALAVSVLIYFIRLFVKLSTSAYHLSRDCPGALSTESILLQLLSMDSKKEQYSPKTAKLSITGTLQIGHDTGLFEDGRGTHNANRAHREAFLALSEGNRTEYR